MELLKNISKLFNVFFPFADFMYILQQEEYSSERFIYWLPRFFWRRNIQVRDTLKYTKRVKYTLSLAVLLFIVDCVLLYAINFIILVPFTLLLIPLYVFISNYILASYYNYIKKGIRLKAAKYIEEQKNLKVVTVAGSFGKTSVKNFLNQIVKYSYKTQMIPGNINTPAGIANWVLNNLKKDTQLLISEVDAYEIGEIVKSTEILEPDISIVTNIGDQHLVRFGNQDNLGRALSETFTYSKPTATLISTSAVFEHLERLGIDLGERSKVVLEQKDLNETNETNDVDLSSLSDSNRINMQFALSVAKILEIPKRFIQDAINNIELPDRRQKHTDNILGFEGIDDSYNISFTTALAGIKEAKLRANAVNKKLLVVTAGIPELSKENEDKNVELGKILSTEADHTIVLRSILSSDIVKGLEARKNGNVGDDRDTVKYTVVDSFKTLVNKELNKFEKAEWFLLLQPELNDLYY